MRLIIPTLALLAAAALPAAPAAAQSQKCTLAVVGTGKPGTTLTFKLTGALPQSFAVVLVGPRAGTTKLRFGPLGTLVLGLQRPFRILPLGFTDKNGDASRALRLPRGRLPQLKLYAQAVTMKLQLKPWPPTLKFCVSNVVSFTFGGGTTRVAPRQGGGRRPQP